MKIEGDAVLLKIFIGESDRCGNIPLYEEIVNRARRQGLAGATVLKGVLGFGASSRIHSAHILRLSADLPVVVEIVDSGEKIDSFLSDIDPLIKEGLITREKVRVYVYRHA